MVFWSCKSKFLNGAGAGWRSVSVPSVVVSFRFLRSSLRFLRSSFRLLKTVQTHQKHRGKEGFSVFRASCASAQPPKFRVNRAPQLGGHFLVRIFIRISVAPLAPRRWKRMSTKPAAHPLPVRIAETKGRAPCWLGFVPLVVAPLVLGSVVSFHSAPAVQRFSRTVNSV